MKKLAAALLLCASASFAQSTETAVFRGIMLSSNEVADPPVSMNASGQATLLAHVVRDSSGQIVSGSVDFTVVTDFPADVTATGLHIHNGPAGVNAGVTVSAGLSGANTVRVPAGRFLISRQAQVMATDAAGVETLRGLFRDPSQYYVNLHTTDFPAGVIRGQLERAVTAVLMGFMNSENETGATDMPASGVGVVLAVATRDDSGALTSGEVYLGVSYRFPQQVSFTGLHIHPGAAGVNGPAALPGLLPAALRSDPSGVGSVGLVNGQVALDNQVAVDTFERLFNDPENTYINIHTTGSPAGAMRAQLRRTDRMSFQAPMLSSNEPPSAALVQASAPSNVTLYSLREEDGSIAAGTVVFDVNYRFPGETQFTAMHIHDQKAGFNGPVTIPAPLPESQLRSETGFGNFYVVSAPVADPVGLNTLNSMVRSPENHYLNLHTTVSPGGAVRAQLGPENTAAPVVNSVVSANLEKTATTTAPNGLISIFGSNLAKVPANLDGWKGKTIPDSLNGAAVAIGGRRARILSVEPGRIDAVVPVDTPAGQNLLSVNNGNAPSAPFSVAVATVAPQIFFNPNTLEVIAQKLPDMTPVRDGDPASAGDLIFFYVTGLGQTTPAVETGVLVDDALQANTIPVTVTIGGLDAEVVSSVATPRSVGLYSVTVRVPSGVPAGNPLLVLRAGAAVSNTVSVKVQ